MTGEDDGKALKPNVTLTLETINLSPSARDKDFFRFSSLCFLFWDTDSTLFNFPIQLNFNIPFLHPLRKRSMSPALCYPYLPSHSDLPAATAGRDSFCMRATGIPPPPHVPTSISLIFIFFLSLSPTASDSLPGKVYHSPVTVIKSPTESHRVHGRSLCVSVRVFLNAFFCTVGVTSLFHMIVY